MYSIFLAFDQVQKMVFGYHYKKGTKNLFFFKKKKDIQQRFLTEKLTAFRKTRKLRCDLKYQQLMLQK
jgi:hypothetical protein